MSLLVLALCVAGGLPPWDLADTEVSTNCPCAFEKRHVKHFRIDLDCVGTPSNNVQVAFGRDANTIGVLEIRETGLVIGWDCGQWVMRDGGTNVWVAAPVTTNVTKSLAFDLVVARAQPKDLLTTENGFPLTWNIPMKPPRELYCNEWDAVRLTVRGVDRPEESLLAQVITQGALLLIH